MHLATKFHHPIFNRSEVIVLTNKQTDATENIHFTSLSTPVGKTEKQTKQQQTMIANYLAAAFSLIHNISLGNQTGN